MQKIYIDSRFRTANSKSESDFNVELPRSFNVPDGVVAHIDDIVIPVSWRTVDERNNKCYVRFASTYGGSSTFSNHDFTVPPGNYDGNTFATAFQAGLTTAAAGQITTVTPTPTFVCAYDPKENHITISIVDARSDPTKHAMPYTLQIYTDAELVAAKTDLMPSTVNTMLRNNKTTFLTETAPYDSYLDLFNIRNLYLTSSALCSYDTVSNFGMDTIIKKNPCTAPYNKMIFQSSGSTLDGLDVSKRTLRYLDFKLVDTSFRPIDLQENHFSFSIVFVQRR